MKVAIYARKSNDDERTAEDGRSVDRQVALAREFAAARGWAVAEVFTDDGVSGAEFVNRPGFAGLIGAAKRRAFGAVVVMSLDRLGRDQVRVMMALTELHDAEVAVWLYQTGAEVKMDTPEDVLLASIGAFGGAFYRHTVRKNTREGLVKKAKAGHATGRKTYGYRTERVGTGDSSHAEIRIDEAQAAVVRRVFELCAAGAGDKRIVDALNGPEFAAALRAQDKERRAAKREDREPVLISLPPPAAPAPIAGRACKTGSRGWSKQTVRRLLANEFYAGAVVYGKTGNVTRGGEASRRVTRPKDDWVRADVPHLRIVSDELWAKVRARKARERADYFRAADGRLLGKPECKPESANVLNGVLRCPACGGPMGRLHGAAKYYCVARAQRGACSNAAGVPVAEADAEVVAALKERFFSDPKAVEALVRDRAERWLREHPAPADDRAASEREITKLEREIRNLTDQAARGVDIDVAEYNGRRARIAELKARPQSESKAAEVWRIGKQLSEVRATHLDSGSPRQVRQVLRWLGVERVVVNSDGTFEGLADLGRLVEVGENGLRGPPMAPPGLRRRSRRSNMRAGRAEVKQ